MPRSGSKFLSHLLADPELIQLCRDECERLGNGDLARHVLVYWNPKMRSTAGRAYCQDRRIDLNPRMQKVAPEQIEHTLRHELAHLIAYARWARKSPLKPHGAEWQRACIELGIPGAPVTHQMPLAKRVLKRKWCYICPVCMMKIQRVRPFQRPSACRRCCVENNGGRFDSRFQWRLELSRS